MPRRMHRRISFGGGSFRLLARKLMRVYKNFQKFQCFNILNNLKVILTSLDDNHFKNV